MSTAWVCSCSTSSDLALTGNNLHTNGTAPDQNPDAQVVTWDSNGTATYPWGMEWTYPCGGMPQSPMSNRTKWPVTGGAIAVQPGWFPGHSVAFIYVNIGIQGAGEIAPPNMSHNVVPPFQIVGPDNLEYNGTFCLPQVPLPANTSLQVGQNITIQVVESAQHGAALYNCVDVVLAEPDDPEIPNVNTSNCFNSSDLSFNLLFTTTSLSAAQPVLSTPSITMLSLSVLAILFTFSI